MNWLLAFNFISDEQRPIQPWFGEINTNERRKLYKNGMKK